jgi:hypothetical protein
MGIAGSLTGNLPVHRLDFLVLLQSWLIPLAKLGVLRVHRRMPVRYFNSHANIYACFCTVLSSSCMHYCDSSRICRIFSTVLGVPCMMGRLET